MEVLIPPYLDRSILIVILQFVRKLVILDLEPRLEERSPQPDSFVCLLHHMPWPCRAVVVPCHVATCPGQPGGNLVHIGAQGLGPKPK